MHTAGLFKKLFASNVIEKQPDRLDFTFSFESYLSWHSERNKLSHGSIEDWAEMLSGYHNSLESLSSEEVAAVIVLLEYAASAEGPALSQ